MLISNFDKILRFVTCLQSLAKSNPFAPIQPSLSSLFLCFFYSFFLVPPFLVLLKSLVGDFVVMDQTWRFARGGDEEAGFQMESAMKEEDRDKKRNGNMKSCKIATWVISMVVACLMGGLVFGWWVFQFHPTNRQLWMVPFSLVLMIAPIFVMMSLLISAFCNSMNQTTTSAAPSSDHVIQQSVQIRWSFIYNFTLPSHQFFLLFPSQVS